MRGSAERSLCRVVAVVEDQENICVMQTIAYGVQVMGTGLACKKNILYLAQYTAFV